MILLLLCGCLHLDIVVLADFSTSIRGKEQFIQTAVNGFTKSFKDEEDVRIGIITFDDRAKLFSPLTEHPPELTEVSGSRRGFPFALNASRRHRN